VRDDGRIYVREAAHIKSWDGTRTEFIAGLAGTSTAMDGLPKAEWRFTAPVGLTYGKQGELFLADTGAGRIYRIREAEKLDTIASGLTAPFALAADVLGNLYIADKLERTIYRLEFTGKLTAIPIHHASRPLLEPTALTIGPDGLTLYIADTGSGTIRRLDADGTLRVIAGGGGSIDDVAALQSKLRSPAGLTFDSAGNLWFTEASSGRVRKLTPQGHIESLPGVQFEEPRAIRADSAGNLFVADATAHRIYRISPDRRWQPVAGTGGRSFTGDAGAALEATLHTPLDLIVEADGSVLVADTGNRRIRRLTPDTQLPPVDPGGVEPPLPPSDVGSITVHHFVTSDAAVAPGQLVRIRGNDLGAVTEVRFNGSKAAVVERQVTELTVQVPTDLTPGSHLVQVFAGPQLRSEGATTVVLRAPALLSTPSGEALALQQDGTLHGATNPAAAGSILVLYGTGEGLAWSTVAVEVGGVPCEVLYAGTAPGIIGAFQINFRMPATGVPAGALPVVVLIDGTPTPTGVRVFAR
jgi:uncharacterized protein (TIGR03437 family)